MLGLVMARGGLLGLALAGDPNYTREKGQYCVGCHPGPPMWSGHFADVSLCEAKCNALNCGCYDFAQEGEQAGACRLTNSSQKTKQSHAGFDAYVHDGWSPGPPPLPATSASLTVDFASPSTPLKKFWRSCGWCPPDPHPSFPSYFALEDLLQNHLMIGSVPHRGIQYVRIHYLFDLIKLLPASSPAEAHADAQSSHYRFDSASAPYLQDVGLNFTALDRAMDQLTSAGLAPGFEIMGNPGNRDDRDDRLFTDFSDHAQILAWKDLVHAVASRYIERYGAPAVRQWRWESWNEPDGQCGRNLTVGIACDLPSFLAYWDATAAGLMEADSHLIFGGPASDGKKAFLYGLVQHCINGTNAITGGRGCGPKTPSFFNAHFKGDQSTMPIVTAELPVASTVAAMIEGTVLEGKVAWGNDEADPKVHWSSDYGWQADARYAAMVPKVIAQHLHYFDPQTTPALGEGFAYDVLSNDNGFLPYPDNNASVFAQRTLVARCVDALHVLYSPLIISPPHAAPARTQHRAIIVCARTPPAAAAAAAATIAACSWVWPPS